MKRRMRENTSAVRASAYANNIASLNQLSIATLVDADAVRVWESYIREDTTGFDRVDEQRLNLMLLTLFRTYETAFLSERYGLLGNNEWGRFERQACGHFRRVQTLGVRDVLQGVLTTDFTDYLTALCLR